jgi:hypothetical protein
VKRPGSESWKGVHRDFDGHLEKPLEAMSMEERLAWAWQGMQLLHWARTRVGRRDKPTAPHDGNSANG